VALRFCLAHPCVTTTLVGMSTVKQVDENLRALEDSEDLSVLQDIIATIGPDLNYVWPSGRNA
jgi:L-galactose dehydrogenase